jgi:hypothetical protein
MDKRREAVVRALEKLGVASPSEIWRAAADINPLISLQDVNFELYHGSRDPKNMVYKKIGRGKYTLLKLSKPK